MLPSLNKVVLLLPLRYNFHIARNITCTVALCVQHLRPMQTDAARHNIFSPTMLGVSVGTCCVVHANERNNCQNCWQASKEVITDALWYSNPCSVHAQTFSRGQHCCGSMQVDAKNPALRFAGHRTIEIKGLVPPKI